MVNVSDDADGMGRIFEQMAENANAAMTTGNNNNNNSISHNSMSEGMNAFRHHLNQEESSYSSPGEDSSSRSPDGIDHDDSDDASFHTESRDEVKEVQRLAQRETSHVTAWRRVVLLMLLVTATLVTVLTYIFLDGDNEDDFRNSFEQFASSIEDSVRFHLTGVLEATEGLSDVLTAHASSMAKESNNGRTIWPFVTLPNFEVYVSHTRNQAKAEFIMFCPLVRVETLDEWIKYSYKNQGWIDESYEALHKENPDPNSTINQFITNSGDGSRSSKNHYTGENEQYPAAPYWQMSPPPYNRTAAINFNYLSTEGHGKIYEAMVLSKNFVIGDARRSWLIDIAISRDDHDDFHSEFSNTNSKPGFANDHPHSTLMYPVYETYQDKTSKIVGMVLAVLPWDKYLQDLLPDTVKGVDVVLSNTCGQTFTYSVSGNKAEYIGPDDHHNPKYDSFGQEILFSKFLEGKDEPFSEADCLYDFMVYPSTQLEADYDTATPIIFSLVVASTSVIMALTFFVYDGFVQRKNKKIIGAAAQSNAIVSSLFPSTVRERLFQQTNASHHPLTASSLPSSRVVHAINSKGNGNDNDLSMLGKNGLKSFLASGSERFDATTSSSNGNKIVEAAHGNFHASDGISAFKTKPIADLFPETTVLFADLVGFTAWSSVREPSQVFTLLETVYHAFDQIAKMRRVFKVETVGDCYVAVTGLPDPRKDHAIAMARFAHDCLRKIHELTKKLEVTLGPDTGDLSIRVGLHSGPVTAGVLRGERSRFQLFGDTMNTASRMESTGQKGRIQLSQETSDLLIAGGKDHWLKMRTDKVVAKGKGELQTYWLEINSGTSSVTGSSTVGSSVRGPNDEFGGIGTSTHMDTDDNASGMYTDELSEGGANKNIMTSKVARLIDWNVEVLGRLLKQIIVRRDAIMTRRMTQPFVDNIFPHGPVDGTTVLDEVKEIICLPEFDARGAAKSLQHQHDGSGDHFDLSDQVQRQLHNFVANIAALYRENPFHNFEHASHVTMSVVKLLSRIVAPTDISYEIDSKKKMASTLHDHTYGITSDPLTQFACAFSALIHDVDHVGVPNSQLIKENPTLAATYRNKSVAEQNSVDLAWDLLMDDNFAELRSVIYSTQGEMQRFRQLVVNSVMATDILDKDLKALRNARWEKAFSESKDDRVLTSARDDANRKATIVIEHLIQASDVAHTMQHWHIYRKWNERLFAEMSLAFKQGRSDKNPVEFWYKGELGFFDYYIIPLAKKLKECGVFGVSSDEYLNYAEKNRQEWENRGHEVVNEMVNNLLIKEQEDDDDDDDVVVVVTSDEVTLGAGGGGGSSADNNNDDQQQQPLVQRSSLLSARNDDSNHNNNNNNYDDRNSIINSADEEKSIIFERKESTSLSVISSKTSIFDRMESISVSASSEIM